MEIYKINKEEDFKNQGLTREKFVDFLFVHLDEFGDPKSAINKCLDYAFGIDGRPGGFALAAMNDGEIVGALISNKTGMGEYIPENILVYVAVDSSKRGMGIGKKICQKCIEEADGDVCLHVEYDNPAKRLYERIGFTTKYAEMRYKKEK